MDDSRARISGARLFAKLALVIMPCFLGAAYIGLFWLADVDLRRESDALSTRIGNAAARVAIGIERHSEERGRLELGQDALPHRLLNMLLADNAVVCAEYRDDAAGEIRLKAPFGLGCAGQTFDSSLNIPAFTDKDGTLVVNFSIEEIAVARRSRHEFSFLVLGLGSLIMLLSSWLGFRTIIGSPLSQLLQAIRKSRDAGMPCPIETQRRDELGVVMRAFSEMQTRLKQEATAVRDVCRRLDHIYNATPALLFSCDGEGKLRGVSDHWLSVLGYHREEVLGQPIDCYLDDESARQFRNEALAVIASDKSVQDISLALIAHNGQKLDVQLSAVPDRDLDGDKILLCVMSNVTQLRAAEQRLRKLALTDPLTGLPNRRGLIEHLGRVLHRNEDEKGASSVAVLFIDLDSFKLINDTYGHEAGDKLLMEVGERLRLCVRVNDLIARLGGDEFAVVCHRLENPEMVKTVAERILGELKRPFEHGLTQGHVSASIGIAFIEPGMGGPGNILQLADLAMYQAKQSGKGCFQIYSPDLGNKIKSVAVLREQIHQGLRDDGFSLVYQPIVDLANEVPIGAEALLRLSGPDNSSIPPDVFLPVAEETGLIHEVGDWVIEHGIDSLKRFDDHPLGAGFLITLNLSPMQLHEKLADQLDEAFLRHPEARGRIVLEITETALLKRGEMIGDLLAVLREKGVRIALDDFGTGYSSLNHVHDYPVDILKIDRSFVQGLGTREPDMTRRQMAMINATSSLAKELGIVVVAEGIEAAIASRILLDCGITLGQGYLFSPPMNAAACKEWCAASSQSAQFLSAAPSATGLLSVGKDGATANASR